jgi:hypothetical protein
LLFKRYESLKRQQTNENDETMQLAKRECTVRKQKINLKATLAASVCVAGVCPSKQKKRKRFKVDSGYRIETTCVLPKTSSWSSPFAGRAGASP